jgi:hypothetical protein
MLAISDVTVQATMIARELGANMPHNDDDHTRVYSQ